MKKECPHKALGVVWRNGSGQCKHCGRDRGRLWKINNKKKVKEQALSYYDRNRDTIVDRRKQWYRDNKNKQTAYVARVKTQQPEVWAERASKVAARERGHAPARFDEGQTIAGMLAAQEGRCAICSGVLHKPHVDHCHLTGRVRGLLCTKCNPMLGFANDSPEILSRAITYLRNTQGLEHDSAK